MKIKNLYDNTYVRLGVLTPILMYAGPKLAEIPLPETNIRKEIQCFCNDYKLSDSQFASLSLMGLVVGWGVIGTYKESRKYNKKDIEYEWKQLEFDLISKSDSGLEQLIDEDIK